MLTLPTIPKSRAGANTFLSVFSRFVSTGYGVWPLEFSQVPVSGHKDRKALKCIIQVEASIINLPSAKRG